MENPNRLSGRQQDISKWGMEDGAKRMPTGQTAEKVLDGFHNFCGETSFHGWRFLGERNKSIGQKVFWAFVIFGFSGLLVWFSELAITDYTSSTIKVGIADRSAPLDDAFFPSVVVCNINPLRLRQG